MGITFYLMGRFPPIHLFYSIIYPYIVIATVSDKEASTNTVTILLTDIELGLCVRKIIAISQLSIPFVLDIKKSTFTRQISPLTSLHSARQCYPGCWERKYINGLTQHWPPQAKIMRSIHQCNSVKNVCGVTNCSLDWI